VTVSKVVAALLIGGMAISGLASGAPIADETPAADVVSTQADSSQPAAEKAQIPLADRLPPGFKVKKRGKYTLYCKSDTPLGTRFKSETCYDENNMRAYMLALQENKSDVERMRNICSNPCACGNPEAC
jgi:hypothetical protein